MGNKVATRVQRAWISAHTERQDHTQNRRYLDATLNPVERIVVAPTKCLARLEDFAETSQTGNTAKHVTN